MLCSPACGFGNQERNPMPRKQKMPAILFFTGDWLKDPAVRCMSLEARGLWIDMLCLMYESPRRGYLSLANEKPVSGVLLARMVGSGVDEIERLLCEMEECGVYSKEDGVIYSRRMVKDEIDRDNKSKAGKKGMDNRWGNKKDNKAITTLDIETDIEIENITDKKNDSSSNYLANRKARQHQQPDDIVAVLSSIPKERLNNPNKTKMAISDSLDKLEADNPEQERMVIANMLASRIALYYMSDEGQGDYAKLPHNWLADECYLADPSSWERKTDDKSAWSAIINEHRKNQ